MITDDRSEKLLQILQNYLFFFLLIASVVTCCMTLFVSSLSATLHLTLSSENLSTAARLTFGNVLLLSFLLTCIDWIRRKITVEQPVREIQKILQKLIDGDFSARISVSNPMDRFLHFGEIAQSINALAQELAGVETLRTDFIANVSHELKTPLAVIQNYSTMLQQPGLTEEERLEYTKSIIDATGRLSSLITNILKLNKLENQQIYPAVAEYDLSEQLCQSLLQFENIWEKKEISIDTCIEDGIIICADAELLSLVWNNLLSNAFKFTPKGGTVSLSLITDETYATVTVTYTGCGMTPEIGAHIFEKFYQGDTSHSVQGNGLGLALVKQVMDITRGEIEVQSAPGEGSTFTVRIQRKPDGVV